MGEEISPPPSEIFEEMEKPWKEDLVKLSIKYNTPVKEIKDAIVLLKKIVSTGNYAEAMIVLDLIVSNLSTTPYYLSLVPIDSRIINMLVIDHEMLAENKDALGVTGRANAETNIVLIYYTVPGSREIEVSGWKLHWYPVTREGKFFTEPLSRHELETVVKNITRLLSEHRGSKEEVAEEESYGEETAMDAETTSSLEYNKT